MKLTNIIIKKRIINEITQNLIKNMNRDFNNIYCNINNFAYKNSIAKPKNNKKDNKIQYIKYSLYK